MLRGPFLIVVALAAAVPALAAGDTDVCSDTKAEAPARLAACERLIADDKITGKTKAAAYWFRGDTMLKKRDYDKAIVAFQSGTSRSILRDRVVCTRCIGVRDNPSPAVCDDDVPRFSEPRF